MNLAKSSKLLRDSPGLVISNSFYGYESYVEEHKNIGPTINVGFAAMDPKSWIKGGDLVESLMAKQLNGNSFRFFALSDFEDYRDFWSNIDVLLVPSQADNSPNVIHESKLWGIPVVASDVGGIPELISSDFDGLIPAQEISVERMESEIISKNLLRTNLVERHYVATTHRKLLDSSVPAHIDLYKSLLLK
jgi:glycosyltransferase involved in cell wall biosynthesis